MTKPVTPEIVVEITLLPSEAGGRNEAILQGEYRGVLGVGSENFSVRFFVPMQDGFSPSQMQQFGVQFLVPEAALPHFPVGAEFSVWEGHVIGNGRVLEVIQSEQLIQTAKQYADEIIRGVVTPYEGGRRIWMECQLKLDINDHRLDPFVYWSSEYEETSEKERLILCEHALRVAADSLVKRGTAI